MSVKVDDVGSRRSGPKPRDPTVRFWEKVDKTEGCWPWKGARLPKGYGLFAGHQGKRTYAHRFSYELAKGPIPAGTEIDHLCRNRACVNPQHLEAVTRRINLARGSHPNMIACREGRCCKGHALTPENSRVSRRGENTYRVRCKRCHREGEAARRKKRKEVRDVG